MSARELRVGSTLEFDGALCVIEAIRYEYCPSFGEERCVATLHDGEGGYCNMTLDTLCEHLANQETENRLTTTEHEE